MLVQAAANTVTSEQSVRVLVVEDDPNLREALVDTLRLAGFKVLAAEGAEQALEMLRQDSDVAMVVSDVNMGAMSGHQLLARLRTTHPHIPVLLITAYASISDSVEAIRQGAVDYLVKPFEPDQLISAILRFAGERVAQSEELIAADDSSIQLLQLARRVAQSDSTALLLGESGTGKEVLARYIHKTSDRADGPFVAINCAAIPENMLEAMLFGHEKGAYTGAHTGAPGKFEQANGGTLLLDEISEMDLGLQAKLLRVLQEREVERLGGRRSIPLNVRVIATSNRDMRREVGLGRFREDLYFRLSVLPLHWAPLRDRKGDILPLALQLLARHAAKQRRIGVRLSDEARRALVDYPWPGNVRELDNVMQRALILQPGGIIQAQDLGLHAMNPFSTKPSLLDDPAEPLGFAAEVSTPVAVAEEGDNNDLLGTDLRQREFEVIAQTLRQERGSKKNTAQRLGISPRTLRYKLARLREQGYDLEQRVHP